MTSPGGVGAARGDAPTSVGTQPEAGYSATSGRCSCGSTVNLCNDGRWRHFGKPFVAGRPTLICEAPAMTATGADGAPTTCCPTSIRPAGKKFRAYCSCGWVSSPRVSARAALDAIECEHGWSRGSDWDRDGDMSWNTAAKLAALTGGSS